MIRRNIILRRWRLPTLAIALVISTTAPVTMAQSVQHHHGENADVTYTLAISAASPQPPLMKHRLYPAYSEQFPGNAAPLYHRAILLISQQSAHLKTPTEYWELIETWRELPLDQLPIDKVEEVIDSHAGALQEASYAARRMDCDWGLPIREKGSNIFTVILPEIQEMRTVARLLALRIRLRLAQGRLDEAIADLQTGYAMARHVGNRDFIVNALIGVAIGSIMHEQLLTAISVDSTPNLYWSIVNQPTPLIDIRNAADVESDAVITIFPELKEAEHEIGDRAFWDRKLTDVIARVEEMQFNPRSLALNEWETLAYRAALFGQVSRIKQELVEQMGYDQDQVAAMPGSRAILLYSLNDFQRLRDEYFAPLGLPCYQAEKFYPAANRFSSDITVGDPLGVARLFLPGLLPFQKSAARLQRWSAMLQNLEAIRDYAATHGELPSSLRQIDHLPIPHNPFDDQPFGYQRSADQPQSATLEGAGANLSVRFQITLRTP